MTRPGRTHQDTPQDTSQDTSMTRPGRAPGHPGDTPRACTRTCPRTLPSWQRAQVTNQADNWAAFREYQNVHYTSVHRPRSVLLVWPAVSRAVEAYTYYAFLDKLALSKVLGGKLGGWVQTSSGLSPLGSLLQKESYRMIRSQCLKLWQKGPLCIQMSEASGSG